MSCSTPAEAAASFRTYLTNLLSKSQNIEPGSTPINKTNSISAVLSDASKQLRQISRPAEAEALDQVREKVIDSPSFGGLGLSDDDTPTTKQYNEIEFLCEAWLESVKSQKLSRDYLDINASRPKDAKPMTLAQKVFTQHTLVSKEAEHGLALGDVVRVGVDWIIASELSWAAMAKTYEELGSPGIWRNDRFWIAGDHVVHPSIADNPKIKAYVDASDKAKKDFLMTENQGMNYTIMHTEFVRERAEPGMMVIGSDSHTCVSVLNVTHT